MSREVKVSALMWWTGVAQSRGAAWAESLADVIPLDRPWPAVTAERMLAIARRKLADLTGYARLLELLAVEVIRGAARWWAAERRRRSERLG
jgi:hypothetical protein